MRCLTFIACLLILFSCHKKDASTYETVPASIRQFYESSSFCDSHCTTEIWLVTYNSETYYGTDYRGFQCPDLMVKTIYFNDGTQVEVLSDLWNKIVHEGTYERMLWRCSKWYCPNKHIYASRRRSCKRSICSSFFIIRISACHQLKWAIFNKFSDININSPKS